MQASRALRYVAYLVSNIAPAGSQLGGSGSQLFETEANNFQEEPLIRMQLCCLHLAAYVAGSDAPSQLETLQNWFLVGLEQQISGLHANMSACSSSRGSHFGATYQLLCGLSALLSPSPFLALEATQRRLHSAFSVLQAGAIHPLISSVVESLVTGRLELLTAHQQRTDSPKPVVGLRLPNPTTFLLPTA